MNTTIFGEEVTMKNKKHLTKLAKSHNLNHPHEYREYVKYRCKGQLENFYCYRFINTSVKCQRQFYKRLKKLRKIISTEIHSIWHYFFNGNKKELEKAGLIDLIKSTETETGIEYAYKFEPTETTLGEDTK